MFLHPNSDDQPRRPIPNVTVPPRIESISLVKIAKIRQEIPRKATCLALDYVTITRGVEVGVENFIHAPHLACAVVNAGDGILGAQVEKARKLDLYLGPRALPNNTVVHNEEYLFVRVRGSSRPDDAPRGPSVCLWVVACTRRSAS